MSEFLSRITTRDIIAVLVVGAALVFNGISLATGRPVDAATLTLAGAVVGYYFKDPNKGVLDRGGEDEVVAPPAIGDGAD